MMANTYGGVGSLTIELMGLNREDVKIFRGPTSGYVIQINDTGERFPFSPLSVTDKIEFEHGQVLFASGVQPDGILYDGTVNADVISGVVQLQVLQG